SVLSSAFIKRLRMISLPAGQARLWKPDLSAYRQQRLLPQGLPPDERGLRWVEGQAFLTLDAHHYAVRPKPQTELWEVLAPSEVANRYSPVLETNGSGAWRHDTELVQEWDRLTLFRRFGFTRERIPDDAALRALAVSGVEDSVL
ncbi:leucine-rich repeat domain-containing protein, partial [Pseudomonas sp. MWU13-2860]